MGEWGAELEKLRQREVFSLCNEAFGVGANWRQATLLSWQHRQTQPCRAVNTAVFESLFLNPEPRGPP